MSEDHHKRVSICRKGQNTYLCCVVPRAAAVAAVDSSSSATVKATDCLNAEGWEQGSAVVVVSVEANGTLKPMVTFETLQAAYDEMGPFDRKDEFPALFGAILLDRLYFLVATRVLEAAPLPMGGHAVRVVESQWVHCDLPYVPRPYVCTKDKKRIEAFVSTKFEGGYYYSDDADLQRQCPYDANRAQLDWSCDWSATLRSVFVAASIEAACSVLIRGFVGSHQLKLINGETLNVLLIGRQHNGNPGPRYYGRGLNGGNFAGNDHVYEYVMWRYDADAAQQPMERRLSTGSTSTPAEVHPAMVSGNSFSGGRKRSGVILRKNKVQFAVHTFLRGTIPVRWRSDVNARIGDAEMIFGPQEEVLRGSEEYFDRVTSMLQNVMRQQGSDPEIQPALRCINLLRQANHPGEAKLSRFYVDAVRRADAKLQGTHRKLELAHLDWLNTVKDMSVGTAIEVFWVQAVPFLAAEEHSVDHSSSDEDEDFDDCGDDEKADGVVEQNVGNPSSESANPPQQHVDDQGEERRRQVFKSTAVALGSLRRGSNVWWYTSQHNFVRINCADSLDRTNLCCFFTCIQMSLEMLRGLGIAPSSIIDPRTQQPGGPDEEHNMMSPVMDLAATGGAESDYFSLDIPRNAAAKIRKPFIRRRDQLREPQRVPQALLRGLSGVFVLNGDCIAQLYTNSGAMHTDLLRGMAEMKGASTSLVIGAQRRYENVFEDKAKFRGLETLLGRNLDYHFPTLHSVFCVRPLPTDLWPFAVVLRGVPKGMSLEEVDAAVRAVWDTLEGVPSSSALVMQLHVAGEIEAEADEDNEFVQQSNSVIYEDEEEEETPASPAPVSPTTTPPPESPSQSPKTSLAAPSGDTRVAVIEFDRDFCGIVNAVEKLVGLGRVADATSPLLGAWFGAYNFTLAGGRGERNQSKSSPGGIAHSIKSGLKSLFTGVRK